MTTLKVPAEIYHQVAARIRQRRLNLGMSQRKLGQMIGASYRQVDKYERGLNRVSASVLYAVSQALGVPVEYFFNAVGSSSLKSKRIAIDARADNHRVRSD